jgi:hypothetical protein
VHTHGVLSPVAAQIALLPGVPEKLLAEHVASAQGDCRACVVGGHHGYHRWPCTLYFAAEQILTARGALPAPRIQLDRPPLRISHGLPDQPFADVIVIEYVNRVTQHEGTRAEASQLAARHGLRMAIDTLAYLTWRLPER